MSDFNTSACFFFLLLKRASVELKLSASFRLSVGGNLGQILTVHVLDF